MTEPTVSVVVPNYNHADYLEERLESIVGQTFNDFELILLDDASTDDSRSILDRYSQDPRARTHYNQTNSGSPFKQWNRGVGLAQGRYVWIAESDDAADPQLLRGLVDVLEANTQLGLAYCQSLRADPQGRILSSGFDWTVDLDSDRWRKNFTGNGREECQRFLPLKNTIPNASAVVFRKSVYDAVGGAPEHLRYAGDWVTWSRMLLEADFAFVAEEWNRFRVHGGSQRSRSVADGKWAEEHYRVLETLTQRVDLAADVKRRALRICMGKWVTSASIADSRMTDDDHDRLHTLASGLDPALVRSAIRVVHPRNVFRYLTFLARLRRMSRR